MHFDRSNYGNAKIGVATDDTACGKYCRFNPGDGKEKETRLNMYVATAYIKSP
jgi:hypothetical protein